MRQIYKMLINTLEISRTTFPTSLVKHVKSFLNDNDVVSIAYMFYIIDVTYSHDVRPRGSAISLP